jgi:hypothetical protein
MVTRPVTSDVLARLRDERDAADRAYNEALTAVDQALPRPTELPPLPQAYDDQQVAPINKSWQGRQTYLDKRDRLHASRINLVEIDLVRQGPWVLSIPRDYVPPHCLSGYHACVRREWQSHLQGITHVDGTARLQALERDIGWRPIGIEPGEALPPVPPKMLVLIEGAKGPRDEHLRIAEQRARDFNHLLLGNGARPDRSFPGFLSGDD